MQCAGHQLRGHCAARGGSWGAPEFVGFLVFYAIRNNLPMASREDIP